MSAGIDSNVLVYAGVVPHKGTATEEFKRLRIRAKLLLHQLQKDTIILPTVAITELLVPVPSHQKGLLITSLAERFVCPTFDLPAAAIAADLWAKYKKLPADLQYKGRHVMRADAMIVASAKAAGATEFYTSDKRCRTMAGLVMTARDLPTRPDARTPDALFIMGEIERGEI